MGEKQDEKQARRRRIPLKQEDKKAFKGKKEHQEVKPPHEARNLEDIHGEKSQSEERHGSKPPHEVSNLELVHGEGSQRCAAA